MGLILRQSYSLVYEKHIVWVELVQDWAFVRYAAQISLFFVYRPSFDQLAVLFLLTLLLFISVELLSKRLIDVIILGKRVLSMDLDFIIYQS